MSASSKFDLASSSPDRPLYTSGQRGSNGAAAMDRSASFRENRDSPIVPALPNMTKGGSSATQEDVAAFLQCLRFDPKQMVTNHKLNRPVDFKRLACLSLGVPPEDSSSMPPKGKPISSPSPEEFRRLKAALRESCTKARERVKVFNESLSGMNKLFPTIPSRKRSRSDAVCNDRSNSLYSADRSVSGPNITKMVSQSQASTSGFEVEQRLKEGTDGVPSKRARTSMVDHRVDGRTNTPIRPPGNADRDREVLKIPNLSSVQSEDRMLHVAVDGWERSKMKKKRSGIKSDVAASSAGSKPIDGTRDAKQGVQRLLTDPRSRISDSHGLRPGVANGGVAKVDSAGPAMGSGMRVAMARAEQDNLPLLHNKKDRSVEKERVNLKAINKSNGREDLSSGSPTSSTKLNASARAPRSGSNAGPKLSPSVSRATSANDWEVSQCTSKLTAQSGINSRKRTPSMRSSSPPVAQWASHKPHKVSRTARRTNLLPIVQSNDEAPVLDTTSVGNDRNFLGNSPQQGKLRSDHFSSSTLSESEESGPSELKSKGKPKKSDDMDEKSAQNVQKMSNLMLPPRKSKNINGEDPGDGIRRQGRTGRNSSTRSLTPLAVERIGNVGAAKQLRSGRLGFEKTERTGRPPSRKPSDRKVYSRQKHTIVSADFLDDGHEELLAATNAVISPAQDTFWSQMEQLFRFISERDLCFLKHQGTSEPARTTLAHVPSGLECTSLVASELGRGPKLKCAENSQELIPSKISSLDEVSLYQRLIAAIIPEQDEEHYCTGIDDVYKSEFEMEKDMNFDNTGMLQNQGFSGFPTSNGCRIDANGRFLDEMEHILHGDNILSISDPGTNCMYDKTQNGPLSDRALMPGSECSQLQYNNMSISERILLEFHCIGIFPDVTPVSGHYAEGEIPGEIAVLNEKYLEHLSRRKRLLARLSKSVEEAGVLQEKEFEQLALDKLVGMAYEKYMTCWGPGAHGMKSASGKMAKQSSLAFVRRTLDRCQEFEDTGKSCFSDPLLLNMFLSRVSRLGDGHTTDAIPDGESGKIRANVPGGMSDGRSSVPMGSQQSPSLMNHGLYSSETPLSVNMSSEQAFGREETWSSRVRKKELLLDDVGGGVIGTSSVVASGIGGSFSSSAKGKRSERDREGKGNQREGSSRNGTAKLGRPASVNVKGERKSKAKPKQKTTELTASVNGLLGKMSDKSKGVYSSTTKPSDSTSNAVANDRLDYNLDELDDPIDLSGLQIPEMDCLGVPEDLETQGQDIGSWLNIDDDGLQDHDFMGLEIPMDDLSELKMMV